VRACGGKNGEFLLSFFPLPTVLAFHCHEKIPEVINFKEEKYILVHNFRGFSPWLLGPIAFRLVVRQNIMEVHDGTNLLTSWQPGEGD
jgi:hypothetical protein